MTAPPVRCSRLYTVQGSSEKRNDVIFCGNTGLKPESNVVFFGGDVQVTTLKGSKQDHKSFKQKYRQIQILLLNTFQHSLKKFRTGTLMVARFGLAQWVGDVALWVGGVWPSG